MPGLRSLEGKRVVLTGAAGGIGSVLARMLTDLGARLELVDRDADGLDHLLGSLSAVRPGCRVRTFAVDLTAPGGVDRLAADLGPEPLHVLINNAGVAPGAVFGDMAPSDLDWVLDTNLRTVVRLTHRMLPCLFAAGRAQIVNVASAAGLAGAGGMCVYAASKFGVVGFSEALRAELADRGVGVSAVCPAFVRTRIIHNSKPAPSGDPAADAERIDKLDGLVQRKGISPEKVARLVLKAIRRNRGRVVIGAGTRALLVLRFFCPSLLDRINRSNFLKLKRWGMLR